MKQWGGARRPGAGMGSVVRRHAGLAGIMAAASLALAGCQSADTKAANAAMEAEALAQQGQLRPALEKAIEATTLNDSQSTYWMLLARIQQAAGMAGASYDSFQKVLESDPNNLEALNTLCLIALNTGRADDLDRFADRLLAINMYDRNALTFKGGAAVLRGDKRTANSYLDSLLVGNPNDPGPLILKARLLAQSPDTAAEGAAMIEKSLEGGGDPKDRLAFLRDLYRRQGNRPALRHTLQRMVDASPNDVGSALAYATLLYDEGSLAPAREMVAKAMAAAPNSVDAATAILEMWRDRGADAMPVDQLADRAAGASPRMRGMLAQWANERRRPDVALSIVAPVATAQVGPENVDAAAARAEAMLLSGRTREGTALLDAVLAFDAGHPAALAARSRLAFAQGRRQPAIADARQLVGDNPRNASARLLLSDTLFAGGDPELGLLALREAVRTVPDNVRLASRLAERLGPAGDGQDVMRDLTTKASVSLSAWSARRNYCARQGDAVCVTQSAAAIARLRGG